MVAHNPYQEARANRTYNLTFCDTPELYGEWAADPALAAIFAARFDERAVRNIADQPGVESRLRALAYNRLRAEHKSVPPKVLLGVVAEIPLDRGLDTLGAYLDGRVRYVNGTGKRVVLEHDEPALRPHRLALFKASQEVVDETEPFPGVRLAPPKKGDVRLSFVASDGFYVGQAEFKALENDLLGGPILRAAGALMTAVIELAKVKNQA